MYTISSFITLEGRLRRRDFFFHMFGGTLIFGLVGGLLANFNIGVLMLFSFFLMLVGFSAITRRLHDIGISQWWILLIFVPFINFIFGLFLLFKKGMIGLNKYGPDPKGEINDKFDIIIIIGLVCIIILIAYLFWGIVKK